MTPKVLKPVLVLAALFLSPGPLLTAQEPKAAPDPKPVSKEAQRAPSEAKATRPTPKEPAAAGKAKPSSKKPAPAPLPPNYILGEEPAPGKAVARPPRPKLVDKKKKEKIPYNQRLNLNAATREELKRLPGVTDEYATKILAARPYTSKTELVLKEIIPTTVYFLIKDQVGAGPVVAKP